MKTPLPFLLFALCCYLLANPNTHAHRSIKHTLAATNTAQAQCLLLEKAANLHTQIFFSNTNTTTKFPLLNTQNTNQDRGMKVANKKLALVIGNGTYMDGGSLDNPVNDADAMTTALQQLGFKVRPYKNLNQKQLKKAINDYGDELKKGNYDISLFFYAGHGLQVNGQNYLVPTDAAPKSQNDVDEDCIRASKVLGKMADANTIVNIVMLDACRNNPYERSWTRTTQGKGLNFMHAPSGTIIAYATSPGKTAADGSGNNGRYTAAVLNHIHTPNITIEEFFKRVRTSVQDESSYEQTPWESTSLTGNFYFKEEVKTVVVEERKEDKKKYMPPTPKPKTKPTNPIDLIEYNMVYVEGGTFDMGCTSEQGSDCGSDEKPVHQVTLSNFYISKYEVTQAQWKAVMGKNPSHFSGCDECPVDNVSWEDIQEFLKKLSQQTGKNYRLPTEAEWEFAARGGNRSKGYKYAGSNDIEEVAWYWKNSGDKELSGDWDYDKMMENNCKTHVVGTKKANELGIHDMSGNVWEWCSDWYGSDYYASSASANPEGASSGSYRVLRGGSWSSDPDYARVANRYDYYSLSRASHYGFRLAYSY